MQLSLSSKFHFHCKFQVVFIYNYETNNMRKTTHHYDHKTIISANYLCNRIGALLCQWIIP